MRVLVVGATGRVGRRVVDRLLADGHEVTGFARDVTPLPETVRGIAGDVRDAERVVAAVREQDAVVSALGVPPGDAVDDSLSAGMATLVGAMERAGVERLVVVAAAGVLDGPDGGLRMEAPDFPPFLREIAAEHRRVAETLSASGLRWTLVCPPNMPDGDATGRVRTAENRLPEGGERVTTGDVAALVATVLKTGQTGRIGIAE